MNKQEEYLERYTSELEALLLRLAEEDGFLGKQLLETEDLTNLFPEIVKPYLGDAVADFEKFPLVSLGWIAFVGMGLAVLWDADWETYGKLTGQELYSGLRQPRGWDELDEYVLEEALGLKKDSEEAQRYTKFLRKAAQQSYSALMHEKAEPSSPLAFQLYGRTLYGLYRLGVALGLASLGYKLHATPLN